MFVEFNLWNFVWDVDNVNTNSLLYLLDKSDDVRDVCNDE